MAIDRRFFTDSVHAGVTPEATSGAVVPPVFLTSTYAQSEPGVHQGWDYSRAGNPSRDHYQTALAALEGAKYGLAFSSGLAAEQAVIQTLERGSRVVVCDDVYGGTGRLFRKLWAKFDLDFQFVDMRDVEETKAAINAGPTKLVWVETPSNPTMKIIDVRKMASLAKAKGALLLVDNTFSSPVFQSPLALGADIVLHSTTKYIGGHSDLIGGALMVSNDALYEQLRFVQFAAGAIPGPFDCYLAHRSLKTLAVRMHQHERNAMAVSEFLASHKQVSRVYFPGLKSDPGYSIAREQMRGYSGMISFDHAGSYQDVVSFLQKLKVFTLAESLGGVESLVNHPELMTHASVPPEMRQKLGIGPQLIRLSCGIEAAEDLVADLQQALAK